VRSAAIGRGKEEAVKRGKEARRKEMKKTDQGLGNKANKMYEGFITNETVATHLWCPFKVKSYFHFLGFFTFRFFHDTAHQSRSHTATQPHKSYQTPRHVFCTVELLV
jgi:hypothetical protein